MDSIINPLNGEEHSINSVEGKEILQNYIKLYKSGGSEGDESIVVPPVPPPRWMRRRFHSFRDPPSHTMIELHHSHIARLTELLRQVHEDRLMSSRERRNYVSFLRDTIEGLERQLHVLAQGNAARDFSGLSERNYLDLDPERPNLEAHIRDEIVRHRDPEVLARRARRAGRISERRRFLDDLSDHLLAPNRTPHPSNVAPTGRWDGDVWVTDTNQDAILANDAEDAEAAPSLPAQGYDPTFDAIDSINEHLEETRSRNIRRHQRRM